VVRFLNVRIYNKGERTLSYLSSRITYLHYINYVCVKCYPSFFYQFTFACKRTNCRLSPKFRGNGLDFRPSSAWGKEECDVPAIRYLQTTNQLLIQSAISSVSYHRSVLFYHGRRINKKFFNRNYSKVWTVKYLMIIFLFSTVLTLRRRIKSHLLFAGIIRSSPFSLR